MKPTTQSNGNGIVALTTQLWQAAVNLRGSIEPADYKRYVLPIIFLRFLSLRYERRRAELEKLIADPSSDYYTGDPKAATPRRPRRVPPRRRVHRARRRPLGQHRHAAPRPTTSRSGSTTSWKLLEKTLPRQAPRAAAAHLRRLEPRRARTSPALINLFSKDVFKQDHGGEDLIGRVYEYFIGEFASSEGKRGGEYFTPVSIVRTLVAMLEPSSGVVFDPCCGSGGMFVQSDVFTQHSDAALLLRPGDRKDFTYRLCRMNLFIHGIDGKIELGQLVLRRPARRR